MRWSLGINNIGPMHDRKLISGIEDSVTFRDPEKTSLKTSFQEFVSLRNAKKHYSPPTHSVRSQIRQSSLSRPLKKPAQRRTFLMVGDRGLEPPTSRSQTARASQLRQSPKHLTHYRLFSDFF